MLSGPGALLFLSLSIASSTSSYHGGFFFISVFITIQTMDIKLLPSLHLFVRCFHLSKIGIL
jgi:hypothetical protein